MVSIDTLVSLGAMSA